MAHKVLILGNSGTGKSASLRNFEDNEITVINCAGKPLPFRNKFRQITPRFEYLAKDIINAMDQAKTKVIVIDDMQYILSFPMMKRIYENGWDKWNDIQGDFFNIIQACDYMPNDVIVYFLSHIQRTEDGHEKIKTVGKMLDEKITIEGLFTTVLKTSVSDGNYYFLTQNSGFDTVKSPIGMFDSYAIDNDLKYVDTKIRNYYDIGDHVTDDEIKALDEKAAAPEVEKPDADGRKRRKRKERVDNGENENAREEKPEEALTEETEEKPKRRRKARNGDNNGGSESKSDTAETGGSNTDNPANDSGIEKPKRRRRKKPGEEFGSFEELENEVPF